MSALATNNPAMPETGDTATPVVDVSGLGRTFDVSKPWLNRVLERQPRALLKAAQDISFTIGRGETFALVGESGSGKSTVAKMVVGLLAASTGTIRIDGVDMRQRAQTGAEMRDLRRRIQMIFQDPYASLNPRWRGGAPVLLGRPQSPPPPEIPARDTPRLRVQSPPCRCISHWHTWAIRGIASNEQSVLYFRFVFLENI